MRSMKRFVMCVAVLASVLFGTTVCPQSKAPEDRTLSPYFFVKSDDPQVDALPLRSTSALVNVSGVIADVQVTQIYKNEGMKPLEAIYVFPASTKAAVYGMKMTIGERVVLARISKREDARREYEQAREQGRSASLLEQQRPNVFQMNVANIMPGDEIKVELQYTELLVPTDKVYEFVYPTVVGPRYSNPSSETASPSHPWVRNPYLHQGEQPPYTFDITVGLAAGLPIRELECPTHKVATTFEGPGFATITLDPSEHAGGNRDYILRYRLDGDRMQSGLLLYQGERENFFLLTMQPPRRVTRGEIPGREYIFIVDVSGSMHGFPLDISKKLMKNLLGNLLPTDTFNVLLFSGGSSLMSEQSVPATSENIQRAVDVIDRQQGGGGTELLPAFRRALALRKADGYSRTIVIATDGYVTVEEEVFDLVRKNLGEANVFAFGIGSSVNRHIIEGMARVGMGEPFVITKPEDATAQAERFRTLVQSPVLTQIKLGFRGFDVYDVEPLSIPDVLAERPILVFGKWRGQPGGTISLAGTSGNGPYRETVDVGKMRPHKRNAALRYLWARHRIALLSDYNKLRPRDERVKEVTELGLAYNLLTAYTSFVAVDSEVRNTTGESTTIKQPLPLPQGVSDYAVGKMSVGEARVMSPLAPMQEFSGVTRDPIPRAQQGSTAEEKRTAALDNVTVSEGLSRDAVVSFIQKHLREIEQCTGGSTPRGTLVLELTVTPDGKIKTAKVVSGTLNNSNAERCLLDTVKKWQFPAGQGGRQGTARVSLVFESK